MNANNEGSDQDYDEDLPDFSAPEWEEKWMNATFSPGEPIDLDSVRVRNLPDGTTRVSYDLLPQGGRARESHATLRPARTTEPTDVGAIAGETSPPTAKRPRITKRSSA